MKRSFKKNIYENQVERNKAWANNFQLYEKNQAFLDEKYSMDSKKQIFDEIQIGEVIYAKMPLSPQEMEKIPPLHRQRPYIVVGKKKDALITYPASHKMPNHQNEDYIFRIHSSLNKYYHRSGEIFRSWTDSHYDLKKLHFIPIENIIEVFQIPQYSDIQRLERQLVLLKNRGKRAFVMDITFPVREGDILAFEKVGFENIGKNKPEDLSKKNKNATETCHFIPVVKICANKTFLEQYDYYYVYSSYKDEIYAHTISEYQDCFDQAEGNEPVKGNEPEKGNEVRKANKLGKKNKLEKGLSKEIEITIGEQKYIIFSQTQKKLNPSDCKNLVFSAARKEVEEINTLKKQLKQKQKEWKNKEKTLKQIRFRFDPGQIIHFRYGYEKYIYFYSYKNVSYVMDLEQYQEIENTLKSYQEYKDVIEIEKLTDIYAYDVQEKMADIPIMKTIVEKAFDENNAYIRDLLLEKLKTEEEKFRALILSMEESAEILLRYYGLSQ